MSIEKKGENCIISKECQTGNNVLLGHNVIIEDNVIIGNNVFIDSNTIIRSGAEIGDNSTICSNCIIGEYQMDYIRDRQYHGHPLKIGSDAIIRSGSIIYSGSSIGCGFQTGHRATIRENSVIGDNCSIGTLSDVQGCCRFGNYVRLHSNVFVGMNTKIDDFVWVFPYCVFTTDPTPPSYTEIGAYVHSFAVVATSSVILPGVEIESDALVAAGSIVTKNVEQYSVVGGNPARKIKDIRTIKDKNTGQPYYPWRYSFSRHMPWDEKGFDSWIEELTEEELSKYQHGLAPDSNT